MEAGIDTALESAPEPGSPEAQSPRSAIPPAIPAAILKGTSRGLEAIVDATAGVDDILERLSARLAEAPGFFRGSNLRVRVHDGPLPAGCLGRLEELAAMFELRIVEIGPAKAAKPEPDAVPHPTFAAGTERSEVRPDAGQLSRATRASGVAPAEGQAAHDSAGSAPAPAVDAPPTAQVEVEIEVLAADAAPSALEPTPLAEPAPTVATSPAVMPELDGPISSDPTRIVIGPVRSGVILEHDGHLIVFGDVNPGAEVRARGNIVVLGRLRGTAHAGIGRDLGFILALRLEPQQLRIGRKVARAGDSDAPSTEAEIAHCQAGSGDGIVVERYLGKLPKNLATSL